MRIDNLVRIVEGELQSSPFIDACHAIHFESHKINRGDVFIAYEADESSLKEAINNGAYAIISTESFNHQDNEIAWIKVTSMMQAIIKLLRFTCTHKELSFVLATPLQTSLLLALQADKTIKKLPTHFLEMAKELFRAKHGSFYCLHDETLAFQLSPTTKRIENTLHVKHFARGLFITAFTDEQRGPFELKLSSLFADDCLSVLAFLEAQTIAANLENFSPIAHFYPQFVTATLRKKDFGMGEKVLIFEKDEALYLQAVAYLLTQCKADDILLCLPKNATLNIKHSLNKFYFESAFECDALSHGAFKYALVLSERETFDAFLTRDFSTQPSLF